MLVTHLWHCLLTVAALLDLAVSSTSSGLPSNVVDLGYVKYRGNLSFPDTVAYLGVPYAEPPLGQLRFRAPLPLNTLRVSRAGRGNVVDLTEYPDFCIQGSIGQGDAGGAGSEDCLKLNIYAPAGAKRGDNLPVLVYIHGGGYVYGNPRNWPFDHWIHQSPNVVIASVYYRLDSLGFLAVPELGHQGIQGDLNAGFLDQIQALRWIQSHISAFGGDPSKVTINGESAGGSSVELHLVSHQSRGLFSQAIGQSVYRAPLPTPEQQRPMFEFYAQQAGCGSGSVASQLGCLRRADVSLLARAQDSVMYNLAGIADKFSYNIRNSTGPYGKFIPVLDRQLFNEAPSISIMKGNFADVPVIVGSTSNETLSGGTNITQALKAFFPQLTQQDLEEYLEEYPASDFESDAQRFQVATGESDVICARAIIGLAAAKKNKAYTYRYNQPVPGHSSSSVSHASENWMMFLGTSTGVNGTTTFEPQSDLDKAFAAELIAYWLSFVRAGDPNAFKLARSPVWPAYTPASRRRIALQEPVQSSQDTSAAASGSDVEEEPALESRRCAFVASKAKQQQA